MQMISFSTKIKFINKKQLFLVQEFKLLMTEMIVFSTQILVTMTKMIIFSTKINFINKYQIYLVQKFKFL